MILELEFDKRDYDIHNETVLFRSAFDPTIATRFWISSLISLLDAHAMDFFNSSCIAHVREVRTSIMIWSS